MLNLVCYPHYTAGALLCDILNTTMSDLDDRGGIHNTMSSQGKIMDVDSDSVLTEFDGKEFVRQIQDLDILPGTWIGTHHWPGAFDISAFDQIICLTTCTARSQQYRWLRACNHWFRPQWQNFTGIDLVDKMRETAKNYLVPFQSVPNTTNIEFSDIVENTARFQQVCGAQDSLESLKRWQQTNAFLYDPGIWNSQAMLAWHQAQYEIALQQPYQYQ
jgi:hypothetical protein